MKRTTIMLEERLMARLRREAARQGRTMSELMEGALRLYFQAESRRGLEAELPELPSFAGGGARVDVADRESLYEVMEGR